MSCLQHIQDATFPVCCGNWLFFGDSDTRERKYFPRAAKSQSAGSLTRSAWGRQEDSVPSVPQIWPQLQKLLVTNLAFTVKQAEGRTSPFFLVFILNPIRSAQGCRNCVRLAKLCAWDPLFPQRAECYRRSRVSLLSVFMSFSMLSSILLRMTMQTHR